MGLGRNWAEYADFANATMPPFPPSLSASLMRPFPLLRLRGLLRAEPQFAVALPEAEQLFDLNRRFAGIVPAAVARACHIAAVRDEIALIYCANGAAASRVRAQSKGVAAALSRPDAPVGGLKVKIRADWNVPPPPEKHDIPVAGLNAFQALEDSLPAGDLKTALERLINRRRGG